MVDLEIEDWFRFVVVKVQGFLRKNSEINFRGLSHENRNDFFFTYIS